LFDEERTIVNTAATKNVDGRSAVERRRITRSWLGKVHRFVVGGNPVAKQNAERFVDQLTRRRPDAERYDVLIIGSGTVGEGSERIYREPRFRIFGVDIYVSSTVTILADAHDLPFADGSIDAVWIQAVLEHVVDPERCVSEIHRVLSPGGVVYSETPFMQQVHEGPYDFLRFSHSGHRWLFRRFEELNSGAINGPATALVWSIRYFVLALSGSKVLARVCFAALGWLRAFDHMVSDDRKILGASGFFFLGEKSESTITLRHIVSYFRGQPG
jgi:SAM-dependent methyltransferase